MRQVTRLEVPFVSLTVVALASLAGCSQGQTGNDTGNEQDVVVIQDNGTDLGPHDATTADGTDVPVVTDVMPTDTQPSDVIAMDTPPPVDTGTPDTAPEDVQAFDAVPSDAMLPTCGVSVDVAAHVADMATNGWSALNRRNQLAMYGCASGSMAVECLSSAPLADDTTIGANRSALAGQHLRVLYTSTGPSSYWTRISPDGRFIARGTHIHDLERGVEVQAANAMYDPAFFPDNTRFMYQPNGHNCPMSVLTTGTPTMVNVAAAPCIGTQVGLYEHLGVALGGGDYWATSAGAAAWDDGGHQPTLTDPPPNQPWLANASVSLSLMVNNGTSFSYLSSVNVATPYQGDAVISPSSQLLLTRLADNTGNNMIGYTLHRLTATHNGAAIMATITPIGRYCVSGAKPAFSLDERWVATHHYVENTDADAQELGFTGRNDPNFAAYHTLGASNVYLIELATGIRRRLTNMAPGQYALYPAFRSDGWIYFNVRALNSAGQSVGIEHIIASDAALLFP